ncbi:hypothetical protein CALVIDRAFT_596610 [Calocera viscosa TUFC12733]|uniref:F-box domain-containing protein n=1 Tax=Calocera viscosa (strain TUFC12733) TaxID=1330018 RepID=A0A167P7A4_CALVF|nr:hypothetical protein CALVIDRAFT_596610 [Calocera viscosa TUFC12733]
MSERAVERVPNELWFDILKLTRQDRGALLIVSQTCKRLRSLTLPVLLHHVALDLETSPHHASSLLAMLGSGYDAGRFVRRMHLRVSTRDIPEDLWQLLKVTSVEDLVLSSSKLSARLFASIIMIPTLRNLNLQSCSMYPPDPIRHIETMDLCQGRFGVNLVSLEVTWQETSVITSLPAILSRLDMSKVQNLSLAGSPCSGTVTSDILSSIYAGSLISLRFPPVRYDARFPQPYDLLRDTLVSQPNIRRLYLHPSIRLSSIPDDALRNLEQFEGSCAMAELLVPGRPVTRVTITTASKFPDPQGDMPKTFQAISRSSKHVKYLELEPMLFDEGWMDDLPMLFPQLEELRVHSTNYLTKGFMRMTMPAHVSKMKACKSIRFRCRGGGAHPLNLLYMPDESGLKWAEQTVVGWGQRNAVLQEVWLGRVALVKVATNEWKAYDEFHFRGPADAYNIPLLLPDRLP